MNTNLQYLLIRMSKIAIYASMLCISLTMAFANESIGQRKRLSEIQIKIDLADKQQLTLQRLIDLVEREGDFTFVYSRKTAKNTFLKLNRSEMTMEDLLMQISRQAHVTVKRVNETISLQAISHDVLPQLEEKVDQELRVSGTVQDEQGESLPGVTVLEKGTGTGAITDFDGKYTINVSNPDAVLVFSFVGFSAQEVSVGNRSVIDVELKVDVKSLEEVVVIGYGEVKKSDLTGSVGSVGEERLVSKGTTSAMEALQGNVAGVDIQQTSVRPGAGFNINIRGVNSLNKDIKPLFVVDGIVTADIDFLNPADIKRIDVLKDASSTAIYGSRGSSGVVIVTTKNAGNAREGKLNVSYDGYYGVRKTTRMPDLMDGREFVEYRVGAYSSFNRATNEWTIPDPGTLIMSNTDGAPGSPVWANRLKEEEYTDWLELVTRDGSQQNHYLNMSGSANNMTYNFGIGYQNEKGNFARENLDRYNLKLSVDHKASDLFRVGVTANVSQTIFSVGSGDAIREVFRMAPFFTPYNPDGSPQVQPGRDGPENHTNRGMTGTLSPLASLHAELNETRRQDILASAYLEITPAEGWSFRTTVYPRYYRNRTGFFKDIIQDNYLQRAPANSIRVGRSTNDESLEYTWDNMVSYSKSLGRHNLSFTGVHSLFGTRAEALKVEVNNLPYASGWYNLFSGDFVPSKSSSSYAESSLVSFLGRVNYDFAGKYLITASLRYDGASRLADKWAAFPSAAVAWNITQEAFLKQASWLTDLKLRLSYGASGTNQGVKPYASVSGPDVSSTLYYNYGDQKDDVVTGFAPGSPVNPALTWEKTREFNLGLDFGIIKSRIYGSLNLYDKLSDGLLLSRNLAIESGVQSMRDNIGSVSNRGIELALNTVNIESKNFQWTTNFTFSKNVNKIVSIYNKEEDDIGNKWFIGEPVRVLHDYQFLGVWTQADYDAERTVYENYTANPGEARVLDANNDNFLNADDKVVLGSPLPDWIGGVTSNMSYKNWDFSFNIVTRQGMLVDDKFSESFLAYGGRSRLHMNYDYYLPAGVPIPDWDNFVLDANGYATDITFKTNTEEHVGKYPLDVNRGGAYYANNGSRLPYYKDASFVKVKNITLGYSFGSGLTEKTGIDHLRVYFNVLNPFVFTSYEGFDPEYAETAVTEGNTISTVTYQMGVNLKF